MSTVYGHILCIQIQIYLEDDSQMIFIIFFIISLIAYDSFCFTPHVLRAKIAQEELIPEDNPFVDPTQISISGVSYGDVLSAINKLYPPKDLFKRNAVSRTDGYWDFIEKGTQPPPHYTYGEYDILFFAQLLDKAYEYHIGFERDESKTGWNGKTFLDIGSGAGRLVFAAAGLHPGLERSVGIEILPSLHKLSLEKLDLCRLSNTFTEEIRADEIDEEKATKNTSGDVAQKFYVEPLTAQLSDIQKALEAMSSEEWKELLGEDYDLLVQSSSEEDQNNASFETFQRDTQENSHEIHNTSQIDMARSTPFELSNGFIIEAESKLFRNMQYEDVLPYDENSIFFESIDDFLSIDHEDWTLLGGKGIRSDIETFSNEGTIAFTNDITTDGTDDEKYELRLAGRSLPLAPCKFVCNSFQDPYEFVGGADVIFVFSSCMSSAMMEELSDCIGRCRTGTIVITTEFPLQSKGVVKPLADDETFPYGEYHINLVDTVTGFNWITKQSTAYIHRVEKSTWDGIQRFKPKLRASDIAYRVIRQYESHSLTNSDDFMRQIRNNMKFHSISETIDEYLGWIFQERNITDDSNSIE